MRLEQGAAWRRPLGPPGHSSTPLCSVPTHTRPPPSVCKDPRQVGTQVTPRQGAALCGASAGGSVPSDPIATPQLQSPAFPTRSTACSGSNTPKAGLPAPTSPRPETAAPSFPPFSSRPTHAASDSEPQQGSEDQGTRHSSLFNFGKTQCSLHSNVAKWCHDPLALGSPIQRDTSHTALKLPTA